MKIYTAKAKWGLRVINMAVEEACIEKAIAFFKQRARQLLGSDSFLITEIIELPE